MSRQRAEVDRSSHPTRAAIESEPVVVGRFAVTLSGVYELLHRIAHRCIEAGDWPLSKEILSEAIAEAGDCEIVTIAGDTAGEEPRPLSSGARHRG